MKKRCLLILVIVLLLTGCGNKPCNSIEKEQSLYLIGEVKVKFTFLETYDECVYRDKEEIVNEETTVTSFELLNEKAKVVFNNIDFNNLSMENALKLLEEVANKNEVEIKSMDLYTTSLKDYSSSLTYEVHTKVVDEDEIDELLNKKVPLNKAFAIKIFSGMEYYFEYLEFINDNEVKYHTEGACYGECDIDTTYKYSSDYDMEKNRIYITLDNENHYIYTYYVDDDKLEYGHDYD